ncbi:hypothetical protein NPIL_390021 [Nephila pilipes]|uniref:Uncharacterized protein n=1 Tax=Nephila pilipes TaxID=299642 RepID=A0A8X6ULW6_NEPPI|nr:hypothetical protein NPIL_390021 [Nephila pilipes]
MSGCNARFKNSCRISQLVCISPCGNPSRTHTKPEKLIPQNISQCLANVVPLALRNKLYHSHSPGSYFLQKARVLAFLQVILLSVAKEVQNPNILIVNGVLDVFP